MILTHTARSIRTRPVRRPGAAVEALEGRTLLSVSLLRDVDPSTANSLDLDRAPFLSGSLFYFTADDGVRGLELWRSDGTAAGTFIVKDVYAGVYGSDPGNFTDVDGTLYFTARSRDGGGWWKTDGTEAGTVRAEQPAITAGLLPNGRRVVVQHVDGIGTEPWTTDAFGNDIRLLKDIGPGPKASYPTLLGTAAGMTFFSAYDDEHGHEPWRTDGTTEGTIPLGDLRPGPAWSNAGFFIAAAGRVFFTAIDGSGQSGLWTTDGTPAGTVKIAAAGTNFNEFKPWENVLLFTKADGELWRTDGTESGTVRLRSFSGVPFLYFGQTLGGFLYFNAPGSYEQGYELWRTDGTPQGTTLVRDINPTPNRGSGPTFFTRIGDELFFSAYTDSTGYALWKTDGTAGGTALVKDVSPTVIPDVYYDIGPWNPRVVNGTLLFTADDGVHGLELWRSDGTPQGTTLVRDINPTPLSSNPSWLTRVGDQVFFSATTRTGTHGSGGARTGGLWKTDGTAAGTTLVKGDGLSIKPPDRYTLPRERPIFADVNGTLLFAAGNPQEGTELWRSDGTAAGTRLVKDINPGPGSSSPVNLTNVNGVAFFTAYHPAYGWELWKSNGTAAGTVLVKDLVAGPTPGTDPTLPTGPGVATSPLPIDHAAKAPTLFTNVNGALFFIADDGGGWDLYKSDGTAAGTVRVADVSAPQANWFRNFVAHDGKLYFSLVDRSDFWDKMWVSDGTETGTRPVATPSGSMLTTTGNPAVAGGRLYFAGSDDAGPRRFDLWSTDGTPAGTTHVTDILSGRAGWGVSNVVALGPSLLVTALIGPTNALTPELWKSDGTAGGTVPVKAGAAVGSGAAAGGTYFYSDYAAETGRELRQSDGTEAGTFLARDIYPGMHPTWSTEDDPGPTELVALGDKVLLAARDDRHGRELWVAAPSGPPHAVVARHVFYNHSKYDGNNPAANEADDAAVDTRVDPVFPGGRALRESYPGNFTNYSRGINGIMIDVSGLPADAVPTADDFAIRSGRTADPSAWGPGPLPSSITVRRGAGVGGTDRVTLLWPDFRGQAGGNAAVANGWLQVTVKATERTGLDAPDTFWFGNLVGAETYVGYQGLGAATGRALWLSLRRRLGRPSPLYDDGDVNHNGRIDAADLAAIRANLGRRLSPFTAPDEQ